ncbi:c-type cytochrome [Aurantiacibacter suaedae]|uniref:c-type cytochrome n=1 Tax=Aurantiacibacter suaedae TaxID=2545755 RepID=UPI0010F4EEEB|nr:cytochrome c [Aurantiacibacter suaedae]
MAFETTASGKWTRAGIAAIALGALGVPAIGALAMPAEEAAATASADAPLTEEQKAESKALFSQFACGSCHALAEAGGTGHIGPEFDGNEGLDKAYIVNIVNNGQGAMPSFGGMIDEAQIDQLATYIVQVKK